jgi:hypothetical protein
MAEEKPKKDRSIKLSAKLPNDVVKIENVDKKFHERWYEGRGVCDIPHPFRCVILGRVGLGKSTLAKNIFLRCQQGRNPFELLYVVHGSSETKEWDEFDPTEIWSDIPDPNDLVKNNKKACIIIDDFEFSNLPKIALTNLSSLFRFVSSHHNFSIIVCYQSFFDVPPIVKKCANMFVLYRPNDDDELGTIARRVGMKKDVMIDLFDNVLPELRDTLCIDLTEGTPCQYRKNLFNMITIRPMKNQKSDKLIKKGKESENE